MPYREKKIFSGDVLEVELYQIYPNGNRIRGIRDSSSSEAQKKLNEKNAKKKLVRLINNNFLSGIDLEVGLSYTEETRPTTREQAQKDMANFIRRIKTYRKKHGLPPLKYIAVIEFTDEETKSGRKVNIHHHIIMSGMDRDEVERLWGKGWANSKRLQADKGGFEALARYITKDPRGSKRWSQSKNLKQPIVKINDKKYTKRMVEKMAQKINDKEYFEKKYKGYMLSHAPQSVPNDISGMAIYIKMHRSKR